MDANTDANSVPETTANKVGMMAYGLGWLSGFYFINAENRLVRFHGMQSVIIFGGITLGMLVADGMFPAPSPLNPPLMALSLAAGFSMWLFLMYKSFRGEMVVVPGFAVLTRKWMRRFGGIPGEQQASRPGEQQAPRPGPDSNVSADLPALAVGEPFDQTGFVTGQILKRIGRWTEVDANFNLGSLVERKPEAGGYTNTYQVHVQSRPPVSIMLFFNEKNVLWGLLVPPFGLNISEVRQVLGEGEATARRPPLQARDYGYLVVAFDPVSGMVDHVAVPGDRSPANAYAVLERWFGKLP